MVRVGLTIAGLRIWGFMVEGLGFRVEGLGVWGLGRGIGKLIVW